MWPCVVGGRVNCTPMVYLHVVNGVQLQGPGVNLMRVWYDLKLRSFCHLMCWVEILNTTLGSTKV